MRSAAFIRWIGAAQTDRTIALVMKDLICDQGGLMGYASGSTHPTGCIWTLPEGDSDYAARWRKLKARFSMSLPKGEARSLSRERKHERGIWQRRYWEHTIRDERDFRQHVDYIHFNPVKHGLVTAVAGWPHSTFRAYAQRGLYPLDWGGANRPNDCSGDEGFDL